MTTLPSLILRAAVNQSITSGSEIPIPNAYWTLRNKQGSASETYDLTKNICPDNVVANRFLLNAAGTYEIHCAITFIGSAVGIRQLTAYNAAGQTVAQAIYNPIGGNQWMQISSLYTSTTSSDYLDIKILQTSGASTTLEAQSNLFSITKIA